MCELYNELHTTVDSIVKAINDKQRIPQIEQYYSRLAETSDIIVKNLQNK